MDGKNINNIKGVSNSTTNNKIPNTKENSWSSALNMQMTSHYKN